MYDIKIVIRNYFFSLENSGLCSFIFYNPKNLTGFWITIWCHGYNGNDEILINALVVNINFKNAFYFPKCHVVATC